MNFIITRLSDKKNPPVPHALLVGKTLFDDPVYGVEANTIEQVMDLAKRARTSSPGDVGLVLWKKAPAGMSLPPELENYPAIEIYDEMR